MPGGMLPDPIVQMATLPPPFRRNSSAFCPTFRAGSTHPPFTRGPPLVLGEHSWVSPCTASAGLAVARPASNVPATITVAIAFLITPPRLLLVRHLLGRRHAGSDCTPPTPADTVACHAHTPAHRPVRRDPEPDSPGT